MDSIHYHPGEGRETLLTFDDEVLTDAEIWGWFHRLFDELNRRGLAGRMHEKADGTVLIGPPSRPRSEPFAEAPRVTP